MSVQHFRSLLFKSTQIQQEIEKEQTRHLPDWMRLLKLKKLRLAIKDRLQEIARQSENTRSARRMQPVMIPRNNNRAGVS
jgi:uncharacterized protein YdcH (DUF465 family)